MHYRLEDASAEQDVGQWIRDCGEVSRDGGDKKACRDRSGGMTGQREAKRKRSVRCSILVHKIPFATVAQDCLQVVIGVGDRIARCALADFKVENVSIRSVDELMGVCGACPEAGTHARCQQSFALVGDEHRIAFQDVEELFLLRVGMTQGGARTWNEASEVDSKIGQAEQVAKWALFAPGHAQGKWLRIVRRFRSDRGVESDDRNRCFCVGHRDCVCAERGMARA